MNLRCTAILFLLLSFFSFHAVSQQLSYTISPYKKDKDTALLIAMVFKGNASGSTVLNIPYKDNGRERPQDQIKILQIKNSKNYKVVASDSSQYIVEHQPNASLTVEYLLHNALKDSVPTMDEVYTQMLTSKYYYFIGESMWIVPEGHPNLKYQIALNWKSFPKQWAHLNTYGANQVKQQFNVPLYDFQNAIYMGGDIRIRTVQINDRPLHLGIRGKWAFSDEELLEVVRKTVTSQRAYWNDYNINSYVVTIIPSKYYTEDDNSMNGRGLNNTFVTVGTNTKRFHIDNLLSLYNHELMHHWIGNTLRHGQPENAYKWFHEGFTDYFTYVAMQEGRLLTPMEYKKKINGILAGYYSDSTNQWPNERLEKEYWSSYYWNRLPYKRGLIFALYLDASIKKETNNQASLKDIIQQMLAEARQSSRSFSQEWFLELLQKKAGKDYTPVVENYITKGTFVPMEEWKRVAHIALQPNEVFDLGFTTDKGGAEMNGIVNFVKEGSNSQKAGIQIGDKIVGYSFTPRSTDTASIIVKRGEQKITLTFLPAGQALVPQLQ